MTRLNPAPAPALVTLAMREPGTDVITEFTLDVERGRLYGPADVLLGTTDADVDAFFDAFLAARNAARREALLNMPTRERMIGARPIATIEALTGISKAAWRDADRTGAATKRAHKAYALLAKVDRAARELMTRRSLEQPWTIAYVDRRGVSRVLPGTLDSYSVSVRRDGATTSIDERLAQLRGKGPEVGKGSA